MDDLTHVLLAAATAQLGFRQRLGRSATWLAVGATLLPDLDVPLAAILNRLGHPVQEIWGGLAHRGVTHSLLVPPLVALLLGWLWWRRSRRGWMESQGRAYRPPVADSTAHPEALAARFAAAEREATEALRSRPRFAPRFACILLAALCHPLLDGCTSYGTELLSPFSRERFALDAMPIVDPLFTLLLLLTLVVCWRLRRRGTDIPPVHGGLVPSLASTAGADGSHMGGTPMPRSEHKGGTPSPRSEHKGGTPSPRGSDAPRAMAVVAAVGLLLAGSYVAAGKVLHDRVVGLARDSAAPAGAPATRSPATPATLLAGPRGTASTLSGGAPQSVSVEAYPALGTILLWRAVVRREGVPGTATGRAVAGWLAARVRPWYDTARIERLWNRAPEAKNTWTARAAELPAAQDYARFARGEVRASYEVQKGRHVVEFHDMRFAWPTDGVESLWPLRVTYDYSGKLQEVQRTHLPRTEDRWQMIRDAWADLWRP